MAMHMVNVRKTVASIVRFVLCAVPGAVIVLVVLPGLLLGGVAPSMLQRALE
jgi:hypothetical protein